MSRPTVYIETTIAGHLTSRLPRDPVVAGRMLVTRDWWARGRARFDCYTSDLVLAEAGQGDPVAAAERLAVLAGLRTLRLAADAERLADQLLIRAALPQKARVDAVHVAIAATAGLNYLLTRNCKHLANAALRATIERVRRDGGFEPPVICTPEHLPEVSP